MEQVSIVNNYYAPLYEHSGDNRFEDEVDLRAHGNEVDRVVQKLRAGGEKRI